MPRCLYYRVVVQARIDRSGRPSHVSERMWSQVQRQMAEIQFEKSSAVRVRCAQTVSVLFVLQKLCAKSQSQDARGKNSQNFNERIVIKTCMYYSY